ncbi:MAG: hypothetical protein EA380_09605 [Phycisphaeraceae bacterium]|nr:MAG: hypothetical protein EA380_09605 [Phycisphaeraceae bacterium]
MKRDTSDEIGESADTGGKSRRVDKKAHHHSILHDALHLMSGRVSHITIRIAIGIAAARIWGAEARGMIAAAMIIAMLVYTIFDLGMAKSIPYMVGRKTAPLKRIIGSAMSMWIVASFLSAMATIAYFYPEQTRGDLPWLWILLAVAQIPSRLLSAYARGFAVGYRKLKFISHLYWLTDPAILCIILIGGVLLGFDSTEDGWIFIAANAVVFGIVSIASFRLIGSEVGLNFRVDLTTWRDMTSRSVVYGLSTVMMVLNYKVNIVLLSIPALGVSKADLGNFTVGVAIAELLWQLPRTMGQILYSRSVNTENAKQAAMQTAHTSRLSMAVAVPFGIALAIVTPWLVPLVYGPDYPNTAMVAQLLLPGVIVFFAAQTFEADLLAKGKPRVVIIVMAPAVVLNVVLNVIFVPRYGINAAALVSTLTYVAAALAMSVVYSRFTGLPLRDLLITRRGDIDFLMKRLRRRAAKRKEKAGRD